LTAASFMVWNRKNSREFPAKSTVHLLRVIDIHDNENETKN